MAANTVPTNFEIPNLFGGVQDTSANQNQPVNNTPTFGGWASGTVTPAFTNPVQNTASVAQPVTTPTQNTTPAASTPTVAPLSLFRTDIGGLNPQQYASQAGIDATRGQLGQNPLFGGFGQTRNEGPFGLAPQSVFNYGGNNHNTGLFQNNVQKYGIEQAMRMLADEQKFSTSMGGGKFTLGNDASLEGYTPSIFTGINPATAPVQQTNSIPNTNPVAAAKTNTASNTLGLEQILQGLFDQTYHNSTPGSNRSGTGSTEGMSINFATMLLAMLLGGGGNQSASSPAPQVTGQAQTIRNPMYSLFY